MTLSRVMQLNGSLTSRRVNADGFQEAGLYSDHNDILLAIHRFTELNRRALEYRSCCDLDQLLQIRLKISMGYIFNPPFERPPFLAIAIKFGSACGTGLSTLSGEAVEMMLAGDVRATDGCFVMTNFEIGLGDARALLFHGTGNDKKRSLHGVAAPSFTIDAVGYLSKYAGCLLLKNKALVTDVYTESAYKRYRQVEGGILVRQDPSILDFESIVGDVEALTRSQRKDVILAWGIGSTRDDNTLSVTLVHDDVLIGNAAGSADHARCCNLAVEDATDRGHYIKLEGATAYCNDPFPSLEGLGVLIDAGVGTIVTPFGSDNTSRQEVINLCDDAEINLCLLPSR